MDPAFKAGGALAKNPYDLTRDPDFLAINPQFANLTFYAGIGDIMSPLIPSDAVNELWQWINSDADARAFLNGTADPWGMVVNPAYLDLTLPRPDMPKLDPFCQTFPAPQLPLCTLDLHPLMATMHLSARGASRGDRLLKTTWNPVGTPPNYGTTPPEASGLRAILTITDTATAARFGLQTAALRNAAGNFVAPTQDGMVASANAMVPRDGISVPDPATKAAAAYPLTVLDYAATIPSQLTAAEGADYATLLNYAVNAGQTPGLGPGQLPPGYVPLPQTLHDQAVAAAAVIKSKAGVPVTTPSSTPPSSPGSTTSPGPGNGSPPYTLPPPEASGPGVQVNVVIPGVSAPFTGTGTGGTHPTSKAGGVITPTPSVSRAGKSTSILTPLTRIGLVRFSLLILLIAGGVLTLAGPLLRAWAAKIPRRAIPPGVHLE